MIYDLFPVPVYKIKFFREFNENETKCFDKIIQSVKQKRDKQLEELNENKKNPNFIEYTDRRHYNTQSDNTFILDTEKDLDEINKFIVAHLRQYYLLSFGKTHKQDVKITQSWLNVNQKGEEHHLHNHPNSVVSGVLYYHCNNQDAIEFWNPYSQGKAVNLNPDKASTNYMTFQGSMYPFSVETFDLILFPSWLEHKVKTNNYDKERVSLSFNSSIIGKVGSELSLTYNEYL